MRNLNELHAVNNQIFNIIMDTFHFITVTAGCKKQGLRLKLMIEKKGFFYKNWLQRRLRGL